uniref:E3 ubiquitin-protein ligase RNF138 n=1 Tax=Hucho hucho TaxID=62062 RepID=A0A4W5KZ61_9TELE
MSNIWDSAEGSLDSCSEEDYDCPICQDVLKTPIRTRDCRHVFCKNCFRLAVRAQGPHCPLCRGPVSETEKRATDVQQQMRERKGQCRACGTTTFLSKMRVHYKSCRKYLEEYGTPLDAPPPPVTPTTQEVSHVSVDTIHMTGQVCPICAATVWGNASYCSRNLIGHLAIRHCFSYDTYMNVGEDDYTQLCLAIQQSLQEGTGIRVTTRP